MVIKNYIEEYVKLNGITHYFLHYPQPQAKEVVIFLHGGPGQTEAHFAYKTCEHFNFCNMVYYDQRGTGKTQIKSKTKTKEVTLDALIEDLSCIIRYIKEKYHTERVILLAHSWGSILGTQYVLKYPNDIIAYLGFGQVVNTIQQEKVWADKLREAIGQSKNAKLQKKLNSLGDYPFIESGKNAIKKAMAFRKLQIKSGVIPKFAGVFKIARKSPVFKFRDIFPFIKSMKTNKNLANILLNYDISGITEYKLPVYYLSGKKDAPGIITAKYFERINAPLKGLYLIDDAGHNTDIDNPETFYKAVKEIIASV